MSTTKAQRLIVAGPASGKTTAAMALEHAGFQVFDTDEISFDRFDLFPAWGEKKWYSMYSNPFVKEYGIAKDRVAALLVTKWLRESDHNVVITNLWGSNFVEGLFGPNGKLPSYVGVGDVADLESRLVERGSSDAAALAKSWVLDPKKAAAKAEKVISLAAGEYLSDVLGLSVTDAQAAKIRAEWKRGRKGKSEEWLTDSLKGVDLSLSFTKTAPKFCLDPKSDDGSLIFTKAWTDRRSAEPYARMKGCKVVEVAKPK